MQEIYDNWIKEGKPTDINGSVDHPVKMYFLWRAQQESGAKIFIETGTSHGDGTAAMVPYFDKIYTIEAHPPSFNYSIARFMDEPKVDIRFGDSGVLLPDILGEIGDQPVVVYLDSHYSGAGTIQLEKDTPIEMELRALADGTGKDKYYIIIDDARGFGLWKDYMSLVDVEIFANRYFPNHIFSLEADEIIIKPKDL